MKFDGHLMAVLDVAVELTNVMTSGAAHGRAYDPPVAAERRARMADVLTPAAGPRPTIDEDDAERLTEFAQQMHLVFAAVDSGHRGIAAGLVNQLLLASGARPQLDHQPADGWNLHFHGTDDTVVTGWTAGCAAGLALAIGSDLVGRLGLCSATRCDRVYVDASRNAGRRFCSTACQNRTKAAAFRARRSASP